MLDRLDETIVAVSSAPGCAAVGIVRLSGTDAIDITDRMGQREEHASPCTVSKARASTRTVSSAVTSDETAQGRANAHDRVNRIGSLATLPGSYRIAGEVSIDEELTLPAVFYLFREPHSYTRQNMVEIQSIGNPVVLDLIVRRAITLGARPAGPGEFTARAFLHGAMSLSEAEAVAGVIRAQSDVQLRASRKLMDGALSQAVSAARNTLAKLLALVEADIDFSQEPIEFITPQGLQTRLTELVNQMRNLLERAVSTEQLDALPRILLFGAPNVGKSSLMNRLSETRRAICAAAAGTTRDVLTAPIQLGRSEAILLDTAGVDESVDEIIAAARAMTLSAAERVDLICLVTDITGPIEPRIVKRIQSLDTRGVVIAANKCDLLPAELVERTARQLQNLKIGPVAAVSAIDGCGVKALRQHLEEALSCSSPTTVSGETMLLNHRQRSSIAEALESMTRALTLSHDTSETIDRADLLAFELREALDALAVITGEVTTEDLLSQVFADFCIGK